MKLPARLLFASLLVLPLLFGLLPGEARASDPADTGAQAFKHTSGHDKKFPRSGPLKATIRRTKFGIPHIKAKDIESLAAGYAYAYAEDNICTIANEYVTVNAKRSRFFGPDETWFFGGPGFTYRNLDADFYFKWVNDQNTVRGLMTQKPPIGPKRGVRAGVKGYVAGYNAYLKETGVDNLPDPACRGADWVKPIKQRDVYRRFYQLGIIASSGAVINGISNAAPVTPAVAERQQRRADERLGSGEGLSALQPKIGSNAYAFGSEMTDNGRGLVLGNPHFPWDGAERLYQAHLTIPGEVDVQGASLGGVPLILIGATRGLAWSHTVATAFRFTPFKLTLPPGDPYSYIVDGEVKPMDAREVTVKARTGDGSLEERSTTIYSTQYGPMVNNLVGVDLPWTDGSGFAVKDVNATNFRYLNHFFDNNRAQTVREYDAIQRKYQGIPWVNSLAADSTGEAYFTMQGAVPNVTDEHAADCNVGAAAFETVGLPILDGSRSACDWKQDESGVAPETMPPDRMPSLFRDDFVHNGNDSHWLTNPEQPLEGFDRIIGIENAERTYRTRIGLIQVEDRAAGTDGLPGTKWNREILEEITLSNRQYLGELWRDDLVRYCDGAPGGRLLGSDGFVEVGPACDALRNWDLRDELDSSGALLFRRFASNLLGNFRTVPTGTQGNIRPGAETLFTTPYDPADPVHTPAGLTTGNPLVGVALADAIGDLGSIGAPVDAGLRGYQSDERGGIDIPIHGGPGSLGVFNAINPRWNPETGGYTNIHHGSSFIMSAQFVDGKCPVEMSTFVTYGQTENQDSPHASDYTKRFSDKQWHEPPFCRKDVKRATLSKERIAVKVRPGRRDPGPGDPPVGPDR